MMKPLFFRFLLCMSITSLGAMALAQTSLNASFDSLKQTGNSAIEGTAADRNINKTDFVSPTQTRDRYLRQTDPLKQNATDSASFGNIPFAKDRMDALDRRSDPETAFQRFVTQSTGKKFPYLVMIYLVKHGLILHNRITFRQITVW